MKHITTILLIISAFITSQYRTSAGPTIQVRDKIIIDNVEYKLNSPLLKHLDSTIYVSLKKKLDFNSAVFSWNFRGHVATFEVKRKLLYLTSIRTFSEHTDFKGMLDMYMDRRGKVFASWVSGTFLCGTGECLHEASNGFDSVYEQEIELTIENGKIVSIRPYTNTTHGSITLDDVRSSLSSNFELSKIPAPKGRVTIKIDAAEFNTDGKVTQWSIELLKGHDDILEPTKEMIIEEVNRVFNSYDWKTYQRNGKWHWDCQSLICPIIF